METPKQKQSLYKDQPGCVIRMHAKVGKGEELFELTRQMHHVQDPDGPVDWVLCRTKDEPDTLWAFEFYRDQASYDRHYSDPVIDEGHKKVIDLLADIPFKTEVHITSSHETEKSYR